MPALVEAGREACLTLRRHPVLRRRAAEARTEATVRAARCSAALAGAVVPLDLMREVACGREQFPQDPAGRAAQGALRALAEVERLGSTWQRAPLHALARLHTVASAGLVAGEVLGRPRLAGVQPGDGVDLRDVDGRALPAPVGAPLAARLEALVGLMLAPTSVPALLVAALAQAEVAVARPFAAGNGVVARAWCRAVVIERGLDPSGVAVWEAALLDAGPRYAAALSGYASGDPAGVVAWIRLFAQAVHAGAMEGLAICDAVLAGRLPG